VWATATPFDSGGSAADAWLMLSYVVLMGIGVTQSYVDVRTHRVYVAITRAAFAWTASTLALHAVVVGEPGALVRMAVCAFLLWAGFLLLARGNESSFGRGDVRLAPVIGMALGYLSYGTLLFGVVVMTGIGATWAIVAMLREGPHARIPYVPAMYGGVLTALLTQV
jgi:leader peptidase (prepilin peptidase)/N-methyltransferase